MKRIISTAACLFSIMALLAQDPNQVQIEAKTVEINKNFLLSLGINLSMPVGDWKEIYKPGIGLEIGGRYGIGQKTSIVADAGYLRFAGKEIGGFKRDPKHHIYLAPGLQFSPVVSENTRIFLRANLGYSSTSISGQSDGSVVILGGIGIERCKNIKREGVPGLSNLPVIGALFRGRRFAERTAAELMIYITPHIFKGED